MIYGSVCSGIEAATVAWHPLGWRPAFFSEIEAFPRAVLTHHYPDVPLHGDFTTIQEGDYAAIDVLVGGTPCQSFSIAGLRSGLDDERGNLALEFCRIARRLGPRWVVWENVPGVLSLDGGRAFGSILGGLAECGYGLAYRVLDAQFVRVDGFGRAVPQRRRRVFVVGYLGDWRRAAAVLFERDSMSGHPPPRREAGQDVALALDASLGRRRGSGMNPNQLAAVAGTLRGGGFDVSEDGTGRGTPIVPVQEVVPQVARTLTRGAESAGKGGYAGRRQEDDDNLVAVAFDETQITSAANRCNPQPGDPSHPLASGARPPTIAFNDAQWRVRRLTPVECERLQGFPDGYTAIPYRGKPAADGPRYKALGNSMAVNVMRWVGRRIEMVDRIGRLAA